MAEPIRFVVAYWNRNSGLVLWNMLASKGPGQTPTIVENGFTSVFEGSDPRARVAALAETPKDSVAVVDLLAAKSKGVANE